MSTQTETIRQALSDAATEFGFVSDHAADLIGMAAETIADDPRNNDDSGEGAAADEEYRRAAIGQYAEEDAIEIDAGAKVSASEDGAWVQAWVWVDAEI